jgi:hypothetical protein
MRFARWVFRIAGIWGFLILTPLYFLQPQIAAASGPITHPEYFYGFIGVALTWQAIFLLMSRDPLRWRPLIPIAIAEKLVFIVPVIGLYLAGKVQPSVVAVSAIDLVWVALFTAVLLTLRSEAPA